jgi:hypothetical protein
MLYKFPDSDIEAKFEMTELELKMTLLQRGEPSVVLVVDKADLAKAFKKVYFK